MAHPSVDKFGELVITKLRDEAIEHYDMMAEQAWKAPDLKELQSELATLSREQQGIVRRCLIASIDAGIHGFLFGIVEDQDSDQSFKILVDGANVAQLSDGLHGEAYTEDGWIAIYGAYSESGEPVSRDE